MKKQVSYQAALAVAQALEAQLRPACERVLIAGSLRRQRAEIGDIELVVLPRMRPVEDMFGMIVGHVSALDDALAGLAPTFRKNGEKFKQFDFEHLPIDLFIASPETWGCIATIRTGSSDFSHWLVSPRRAGGGCPSHLSFRDGRIVANGGAAIATPEERDVFAALELPWVEPAERAAGRWRR